MSEVPLDRVRAAVAAVPDPELPVVSIAELGILRGVERVDGQVLVTITPTYSGCPAVEAIAADIRAVGAGLGIPDIAVRTVLAPPWTTDWITDSGRRKLAAHGIAPPGPAARAGGPVPLQLGAVRCPQCGSPDTTETSRFSSTACKALYTCRSCREPFEHLKAL